MSRFTDDMENQVSYGNLSILPNSNLDQGDGSLEVYGAVYTDTILANTINGTVTLESIKFLDSTIAIDNVTAPINSYPNNQMFYTDTIDSKFKSVDDLGNVTVYQPITTKGDLVTSNGTTQVRLPIGSTGQVLTVNASNPNGLEWANTGSSNVSGITVNTISLPTNNQVAVTDTSVGSSFCFIWPAIYNGQSANYFYSKRSADIIGNVTVINNCKSLINNISLTNTYPAYYGFTLKNTDEDLNGSPFKILDSSQFIKTQITLTGTADTVYSTNTTGVHYLSITSNFFGGPSSNFFISKSVATTGTAAITRISNSPGSSPTTNLQISWPSNGSLRISKSTTSFNGIYNVIDNFQYTNTQTTVTLSGTTGSTVPGNTFGCYTQKSFGVSVISSVTNGPNAIFFVSKNSPGVNGNIYSTRSSGGTTGEQLNLTWGINSLLTLSKTGINYNGNYILTFTKLN